MNQRDFLRQAIRYNYKERIVYYLNKAKNITIDYHLKEVAVEFRADRVAYFYFNFLEDNLLFIENYIRKQKLARIENGN
jgi:uncharacterized protein (DUF2164 family)